MPAGVSEEAYARAAREWQLKYRRRPDSVDVYSWLAERAVADREWPVAVACFALISSDHPQYGRAARHQQGQVLQRLNRLHEAEEQFRTFIRLESGRPGPQSELLIDAMQRLRSILELELRFEERHQLLRSMFEWGDGDLFDTLAYRFPNLMRWNGPNPIARAEAALAVDPDRFEIRRAIGRYRTGQGRLEEAREILEACRHERPDDLPTYAYLLEIEYQARGPQAIAEAVRQLPPPRSDDPWLLLELRGFVGNAERRYADAITCFDLVLESDPANAACHQGKGMAFAGLHEEENQRRELGIAKSLTGIQTRLAWIVQQAAQAPLFEIARTCEEVGLFDHARDVVRHGLRLFPNHGELHALADRLQKKNGDPSSSP